MNWSERMGECVVVEGYAVGSRKVGPELLNARFSIGVILEEGDWPDELVGGHVRVEGTVAERHDLPVFIAREGEPIQQGIPVPEGTNLEEARRRYVLDKATAARVRSQQQVEEDLLSQQGKVVTLTGIIWSLNGHWWFNHDGIDMHVKDWSRIPGWSADMHGRPAALHGRLSREMLPRIDQIVVKPEPDLAQAYLLSGVTLEPHPEWRPMPCQHADSAHSPDVSSSARITAPTP